MENNTFQNFNGYVPVNNTMLYCEALGTGEPLILLHGMGLDRRMWDDQFNKLSEHYYVIRYDLRGFGKSSLPPSENYAHHTDLFSLLNYFNISKAIIAGLSMGGRIAIDFTLTYPDKVSALILVDSAVHGYEVKNYSIETIIVAAKESGTAAANRAWAEHEIFKPAMRKPAVAHLLSQIVSEYSGWHWLNKNPWTPIHPPAIQQLNKIVAPTLIIVGEEDISDLLDIADLLQQNIRGSEKVIMKGVGHMSNMEDPETFNKVVMDFLSRNNDRSIELSS